MATFPPRAWTVRFLQDMENIDCGLIDGDNLTRFALAGPDMLKLVFPVSRILTGAAFSNMIAEVEMKPGDQIRLEKNSISTTWWDFEDLVLSQDAVITDGKGQDTGNEFLAAIGHNKALAAQETNRPGLCMRWVLGTREGSKDVILLAQVKIN